jgi:hypothetical protein
MSGEGRIVLLLVKKLVAFGAGARGIAARPTRQISDSLRGLEIGAARR